MRTTPKMTKMILLSGLLMGNASLSASPLFVEKPREIMPELVMPVNITVEESQPAIMDTDPRSRAVLIDRIRSHAGFEWQNLNAANRFHAFFEKGVSQIDKKVVKELESFLMESKDNKKRVVVIGFADDEGDYKANNALSLKRAERMAAKIKTMNKDVEVTVLSSVLWPGDPEKARRVDVLHY